MSIEKFNPSYDIFNDRLERVKVAIPEAFADGKINWDVLKESLGEFIEEEGVDKEHYAFTWPGKRDAHRLSAKPPQGTLVPVPGEGFNEVATDNIFIEGDNLEVLKLLKKSYAGRVKMIYIDPPYNTGEDRLYEDNFEQPMEEYLKITGQTDAKGMPLVSNKKSDGRYHTKWLNIMCPRLILAASLLDNDGIIAIHIDENECERLVLLMEEVFGAENNLGVVVWDKKNPKGDAVGVAYQHESIVFFAKSVNDLLKSRPLSRNKANAQKILQKAKELFEKRTKNELPEDLKAIIRKYRLDSKEFSGHLKVYDLEQINVEFSEWVSSQEDLSGGEAAYKYIDDVGRVYRPVSMAWPNKKKAPEEYFKPLIHPETGKACPVPGRGWRNPPSTMEDLLKKGLILFGKDESTQPNRKYYLDENVTENVPSVLRFGGSDDSYFKAIGMPLYDNPKPYKFVSQIIDYFTRDGDLVMDFFAGSGTVGHSIYEQCLLDKKKRRFILVQLPAMLSPDNDEQKEAFAFCEKAGLKPMLSELSKERLRRSIKKMENDNAQTKREGVDLGFKVFKLQRSHFKIWKDYSGMDVNKVMDLFAQQVDVLVSGWKAEDLLIEVLLHEGFPLNSKLLVLESIKTNKILRATSDMCEHLLYFCFDKKIDAGTINAMNLSDKDIFICLDSALTDEQKVALSDKGFIKTI